MARLSFYVVDAKYCDFLREQDPCVPYTMDEKARRPFIGILISVNGNDYYAPLSSPKQKHLSMKNQIDFIKISGGEYGAINLNNMIPIHANAIVPVNMRIGKEDSEEDIKYKNLLANQLSWCNAHKNFIIKKAQELYSIIAAGKAFPNLAKRCCNFLLDEVRMREYCKFVGWECSLICPSVKETE